MPPQPADNTNLAIAVPHPTRTLRNAREQVKCMVADDFSLHKIKVYLSRWLCWWANTSGTWDKHGLLQLFINTCHDKYIADIAQQMLHEYLTRLHTVSAGRIVACDSASK